MGANARLQLLSEIHWVCLITCNSATYIYLNGSIIILSGFKVTHFKKKIKLCFLKGPIYMIKTLDLILNMAINTV